MNKHTQASHWRENGEPDPHAKCTDQERSELHLGNLTDDELANAVFLHGDTVPPLAEVIAGTAKMPIVYLTADKERIRWLSRKLVGAEQREQELLEAVALATHQVITCGVAAKHPDANLSRRESDCGGKWDSHQAESVRQLRQERDELLAALVSAVECGMVPTSSAKDGGPLRHARQIRVADQIRDAIAKANGGVA